MDVDEYRAARRTRLIELATELGVPPDESAFVVDEVIEDQQRRIRRAEDPDDVVVPALRDRILRPGRRGGASGVSLLVLAAVVLAIAVAYVPRGERSATVPSLIGFTADEATRTLEGDDIAVRVVEVPQCNPAGQVLGSTPPAGATIGTGEVVTVIATSSPSWSCPADGAARERAWTFLRFLVGGPAHPDFAPGVRVFVDGEPVSDADGAAATIAPWWDSVVRKTVVAYVSRPAPNPLGQPVVSVSQGMPPPATCGHPRPTTAGSGDRATRLVLMAGGEDAGECGLTIDLFTDALDRISGVALYAPATAGTP